jgi:integrase
MLTDKTDIDSLALGTYRDDRGLVLVKRGGAATFYAADSGASRGLRRLGRWPQLTVEKALIKVGVNNPNVTLRQLLSYWVEDATGLTRERLAKELISSGCGFLDSPAIEVTKLAVANWRREVAKSRSLTVSEKLFLKGLRAVFNWAAANGHYDGPNPTAGLPKAKVPKSERDRVLSFAEFNAIHSRIADRSKNLLTFLLLTGCRVSEAVKMREDEEVDSVTKLWTIPASHNKTGVKKKVPLSGLAYQLVASRPYVDSWGVSYQQLWQDFNAARVATGITDVTVHDLRRTWASVAASHATLTEIGTHLGHKSTGVTQIYARQRLEASQRLLETVASQISEGTTCL